ncbi:MAG: ubiquitin-like protein, partial [Bacillota bacterium]|nr:ubiquitin-like protein [Bacillota bacterium]
MKKRILSIVLTLCMVLMLVPISASAMELYVNLNITGAAQLTLEVESGDSIDNVKAKIENETGYSKTIQILRYNGIVLQNGKTLADYNIQKGSTIELSFAPSVSAYATKEQLMDDTFTPNADGTANNIGRLVFGKNSNGDAQEWYILGNDSGVTGDNTIIFAASPIATEQKFNSSTSKKNFQSSFGVYETAPSEVYSNHYGASDLRATLKAMETGNFTEAEQNLMNATTVTTNDTMNSTTYTTTDKLYALAADGMGQSYTTIKAGSSDQTVLSESQYLNNEKEFFLLRSPHTEQSDAVLLARPNS